MTSLGVRIHHRYTNRIRPVPSVHSLFRSDPKKFSKTPRISLEMRFESACPPRISRQIHAAVDIEDVAGNISGLVAGEKNDGGGNIAAGTEAPERNAHLQFLFHLVRQHRGHGRFD